MPLKKINFKFFAFAVMLTVFAAADNLFCVEYAKISGNIADLSKGPSSENPLSNVTVTLTGSSTQTYTTGILGYFEFINLPPGRYTVTPSSAGRIFQPGNRTYNIVYSTADEKNQDFSGIEYVYITKWGSFGTNYGKFKLPSGIAVSSLSCVYVADTENHRMQRFSSSGTVAAYEINIWGEKSSGVPVSSDTPRGFNNPFDVAIDSAGWLYVADTYNNRIQKFDTEADYPDEDNTKIFWGLPGATTGFFNRPNGICSDNINNVFYVADTDNNRILQFSSTGTFLNEWGTLGTGDKQFKQPCDVAVDSEGSIYVADTGNHRIQKFIDDYGTIDFAGTWGSGPSSEDGKFNQPTSIAVDLNDNIYVTDKVNNRVQKFTSAGVYITKWGYYGTGDGKFNTPYGMAVDSYNFVYVSERGNNRIQKFAPASSFVNISGYAIFLSSACMNNVSLILKDSGVPTATFTTGPDGYYEFLNLPIRGNYTVVPSSSGHIFTPVSLTTASITESINDWNFVGISSIVVTKYYIQGYITEKNSDPPDQPVYDAVVYLSGSSSGSFTTTYEGFYLFENLPAYGHYTVTPTYPYGDIGFEPASRTVSSLSGNIENWDFKSFPVAYIKGYVTDVFSKGIHDVKIILSETKSTVTYTDSGGYYEFTGLPVDGHYTVTPSKRDYRFDPVNRYFTDADLPESGADFTARYSTPTITDLNITGYVRGEGGAGVNSVTVSLFRSTTTTSLLDISTTTTETDSTGFFKFSGLVGRSTYTLTPSKLNWTFTPVSSTTDLNDRDKEVDFIASYLYTEAPPNIDIPLGVDGKNVQVQMPAAGAAKVIVEERPEKAAKYRGTVNPDKNEAVGILFKPSVNLAGYINRKFSIRIFSLKGELVDEFSKTPQTADDIWIKWIPKNLASGIYIVHIEGPGVKSTKKIAVLR